MIELPADFDDWKLASPPEYDAHDPMPDDRWPVRPPPVRTELHVEDFPWWPATRLPTPPEPTKNHRNLFDHLDF